VEPIVGVFGRSAKKDAWGRTMMTSKLLAVGAAALVMAVGAGGASPATGRIHGTISMTGGPRGASPVVVGGTVIATKDGNEVARHKVDAGQQFSLRLPVGSYQLSVGDAGLPCAGTAVTVTAGADDAVTLVCSRK
jgi:hypothetical protein